MDREELKAYLQSQLDEIERYRQEQAQHAHHPLNLDQAIGEWVSRYGAVYHDLWMQNRHVLYERRTSGSRPHPQMA